jgi:hypothetical protein
VMRRRAAVELSLLPFARGEVADSVRFLSSPNVANDGNGQLCAGVHSLSKEGVPSRSKEAK